MEASFLLGVNQKEFLFVPGMQTSALSWNAVWWDRGLNILSKAIQYPGASPVDRKRTSRINDICKQLKFKIYTSYQILHTIGGTLHSNLLYHFTCDKEI